jgi:hypothetical protein
MERTQSDPLRKPSAWHVFGAPSKYIFISRDSRRHLLPVVERAERVGRALQIDAVILIDSSEQVQAVLQERWLASTELPQNIDLYAFVLTPGLASRLGPATPGRAIGAGVTEIVLTDWDADHLRSLEDLFRELKETLLSRAEVVVSFDAPDETFLQFQEAISHDESRLDMEELIGLRKRIRDSVPMLDSEQWGRWRGVSNNPSATLAKYREQGRLFAVRQGRSYLYPRFQFTQDAAPLDAVADVLKVVPEDARGWPLLSWFEAPSTVLGGRKPSETLAKDPAAVRAAAADFYSDD